MKCQSLLLAITILLSFTAGHQAFASDKGTASSSSKGSVPPTHVRSVHALGSIPGHFSVTSDGAALYTIALWVPPGRAGVQPDLTLQYKSRSGYGMLGVGWTLKGLPQITRCGKTIAIDGFAAPIEFDSTDPFCLDGQRLVLVSGSHGQEGAEYRTEQDSFARITAHSPDSLGPTYFTAELKDGRIMTFGMRGQDSSPILQVRRVLSVAGPAASNGSIYLLPNVVSQQQVVRLAWAMGEMTDRLGNSMTVTYSQPYVYPHSSPPGNSTILYPQEIDYTGSKTMDTTDDLGSRSVRFFYTPIPNLIGSDYGYVSGVSIWNTQTLTRVEMYAPDPVLKGLMRSYNFSYEAVTATARQLLSSITEKDGSGVALGATTFEWEKGTLEYDISVTNVSDISEGYQYRWVEPADINGDGRSDLLYCSGASPNTTYHIRLSEGDRFGPAADTGFGCPASGHPPFALDFNHTGKNDFVVYVDQYPPAPNASPIHLPDTPCIATVVELGGNSGLPTFRLGPCFPNRHVLIGDINGDGLSDILTYVPGKTDQWQYALNLPPGGTLAQGVSFTGPFDTVATLTTPNKWELDVVDVDGDGAAELIGYRQPSDLRRAVYELGRAPRFPADNIYVGTLYTGVDYFFADTNGDGLFDAYVWDSYIDATVATFLNTGNGYTDYVPSNVGSSIVPTNLLVDAGFRVFDYDSDGRQDLLLRASTGSSSNPLDPDDHIIVMRSNGSTLYPAINLPSQIVPGDQGLIEPLDVDGNGLDDFVVQDNGALLLYRRKGKKPDMLTKITDGFGAVTAITYEPVSNQDVYSAAANCKYPTSCVRSGLWVVSGYSASNGNGGMNGWRYTYQDGEIDLRGRGFLGMGSNTAIFLPTGRQITSTYDLSVAPGETFYPNISTPSVVKDSVPLDSGHTYTRTTVVSNATKITNPHVYFPFAAKITVDSSEAGPAGVSQLSSFSTERTVDNFGNLITLSRDSATGSKYLFHAEYQYLQSQWLINLPTLVDESSTSANQVTANRRVAYLWDSNGLMREEIFQPGDKSGDTWLPLKSIGPAADGVKTLYLTFDRYPNGLVERESLDEQPNSTASRRSVRFSYSGPDQVFESARTDSLGHTIRSYYHPGLGALLGEEDDNHVKGTWQVDGFGRMTKEEISGRDSREFSYQLDPSTQLPVIVEVTGSGRRRLVTYDSLGRPVLQTTVSRSDGLAVVLETKYDDIGWGVGAISQPHFTGANPIFSTVKYDNLGRVRYLQAPDGSLTELTYDGNNVSRLDPLKHVRHILFDGDGHVVKSSETINSQDLITSYAYGPFDVLLSVTDAKHNVTAASYDRLGRILKLNDPDAGQRTFQYTAFGQLNEIDFNGTEKLTFDYDNLGRVRSVDGPGGATDYFWDTALHGIGLLAGTKSADSIATKNTYDTFARESGTTWTVGSETFNVQYQHDGFGRLSGVVYPTVPGHPGRLQVDYRYGTHGDLKFITNHNVPNFFPYYRVLETDAQNNPTNPSGVFDQSELGNKLIERQTEDPLHPGFIGSIETTSTAGDPIQLINTHFDPSGNLDSRNDTVLSLSESFQYDGSDRLTDWNWTQGSTNRTTTFRYDELGNLRSRQELANPSNDSTFKIVPNPGGTPDLVTGLNSEIYGYDKAGRQVKSTTRSIGYTWFDLPSNVTTASGITTFKYDAFQSRVQKTSSSGDDSITIAGLYERRTHSGSVAHIFNVSAKGLPFAQVIWRENGGVYVPGSVEYLHRDHLGSVDVITDSNGVVLERLKYDPFGARLSASNLDEQQAVSQTGETEGFAGHQHDDDLGLINMGARMYDPQLCRFLSPDPIVSNLYYGQAYNRYSYVKNNPLSSTDPSGLDSDSDSGQYVDGWAVSGALYFTPTATPVRNASKSPTPQTKYDPEHWDLLEVELVPDEPAPKPERPKTARQKWLLNHYREVYNDIGYDAGCMDDYCYVYDKDHNVLLSMASNEASADSSATLQIDELAGLGAGVVGGIKFIAEELEARGGVYLLRDLGTDQVVRTGRTNDLLRREFEHARDELLSQYRFEVVRRTDNYLEQRGLEQILHDNLQPPLNFVSPIGLGNPRFQYYYDSAADFLFK
jgi:RHS repeat-associated protein